MGNRDAVISTDNDSTRARICITNLPNYLKNAEVWRMLLERWGIETLLYQRTMIALGQNLYNKSSQLFEKRRGVEDAP